MSRKPTVEEMKAKLARYDERATEEQAKLDKLEKSRAELRERIKKEEEKVRTHNLCGIGGLVYKYFGENLTPQEFKEILDVLFTMDEVQEFVDSEKEKRFLWENPPAEMTSIDEEENKEAASSSYAGAVRESA